jgi:aryl carrier-like protein
VQNLVDAVLGLMGISQDSVGEHDNLPSLGMDSMLLVEVGASYHKRLMRMHPQMQCCFPNTKKASDND